MPKVTIFGGPNGSGKSSIIRSLELEGKERLLEADAIAKAMTPDDPSRSAVAAGREVLTRTREYVQSDQSFAIETTLSGSWTLSVAREARERGFTVVLIFVCVISSERSIQRVRERVAMGGHDVPEEDVRRRYTRSISNACSMLKVVDQAIFFDNSADLPRKMLEFRGGALVYRSPDLPDWATNIIVA